MAFSVTPLGVGEGVGEIVADAVRVIRESGLPNKTDAMFTLIEGDSWAEVMAVVQRAVEAVAARAPGSDLVIKADWRPAVSDAMTRTRGYKRHCPRRAETIAKSLDFQSITALSVVIAQRHLPRTTVPAAVRSAPDGGGRRSERSGYQGSAGRPRSGPRRHSLGCCLVIYARQPTPASRC